MVFYKDSFVLCHDLTDEGEKKYRKILEDRATEILLKHYHPLRYLWNCLCDWIHSLYSE